MNLSGSCSICACWHRVRQRSPVSPFIRKISTSRMYVDVNPIWREFFANPNPATTPEFCFFVAFLKMTFVMRDYVTPGLQAIPKAAASAPEQERLPGTPAQAHQPSTLTRRGSAATFPDPCARWISGRSDEIRSTRPSSVGSLFAAYVDRVRNLSTDDAHWEFTDKHG